MSSTQHHIIRRKVLDAVVVGTEADGFALQRKLADLCQNWLTPALDEAFACVIPNDEHWTIERLDVNAGLFTPETLERDFVGVVAAAVEKQIKERMTEPDASLRRMGRDFGTHDGAKSDATIRRLTDAQSVEAAFLHFLKTGMLPWWFHLPAGQSLEQAMTDAWQAVGSSGDPGSALIESLVSPAACLRLARQFSTPFLETLLQSLSPPSVKAVWDIVAEMARQEVAPETLHRLSERLWLAAFVMVASRRAVTVETLIGEWVHTAPANENADERHAIAHIARAWPEAADDSTPSARHGAATHERREIAHIGRASPETADDSTPSAKQASDKHTASPASLDLNEGIFVDCAGVVLLHPFLPTLFERLRFAADGELLQSDRALAMLHFLATGANRAPEYALALPKLLCGLPLDAPVGAPVELTEDETTEANNLLTSAIGHWDALGGTSPDALRGTFLTRPGKLSKRGDEYLLQVEAQSFDVLLDRLPWGIGVIRLPWMEALLWVEWQM